MKFTSLKKRLLYRILLVSSITTAAFTVLSFYLDYSTEMSTLELTLNQISKTSQGSLAKSVYEIDDEQINVQVKGILATRDVVRVQLIEQNGATAADVSKPLREGFAEQSPLLSFFYRIAPEEKIVQSSKLTYVFDGELIQAGTLIFTASKRNVYARLMYKACYFFVSQGIKTLLVSLVILFLVSSLITSHILHITRFLNQFDFSSRSLEHESLRLERRSIYKGDEFESMVDVINKMVYKIQIANLKSSTTIEKKEQELEEQKEMAQISAKLASIGQLAAGIAHEINNPLAVIDGHSKFLLRIDPSTPEGRARYEKSSDNIQRMVRRISKIVKSLLDFSRTETSQEFESTTVASLVDTVVELCSFRKNNVTLTTQVQDSAVPIECIEVQITQVLVNMVNNAMDAVGETERPWVKISSKYHEDLGMMELAVEDSGPGIPREIAEKIMEPFFTTKPIGKGTGLGLSVSLGIVNLHGGSITIDKESKHTKFRILLPAKRSVKNVS